MKPQSSKRIMPAFRRKASIFAFTLATFTTYQADACANAITLSQVPTSAQFNAALTSLFLAQDDSVAEDPQETGEAGEESQGDDSLDGDSTEATQEATPKLNDESVVQAVTALTGESVAANDPMVQAVQDTAAPLLGNIYENDPSTVPVPTEQAIDDTIEAGNTDEVDAALDEMDPALSEALDEAEEIASDIQEEAADVEGSDSQDGDTDSGQVAEDGTSETGSDDATSEATTDSDEGEPDANEPTAEEAGSDDATADGETAGEEGTTTDEGTAAEDTSTENEGSETEQDDSVEAVEELLDTLIDDDTEVPADEASEDITIDETTPTTEDADETIEATDPEPDLDEVLNQEYETPDAEEHMNLYVPTDFEDNPQTTDLTDNSTETESTGLAQSEEIVLAQVRQTGTQRPTVVTFSEAMIYDETEVQANTSWEEKVANFIIARPYFLMTAAVVSVVVCCFLSQLLLKFSKQCNLSLNRYYIRKRFEKQKMMTNTIQQTQLLRSEQAAREKREQEETTLIIEERGGEHQQEDDVDSEAIQEEESIMEFTHGTQQNDDEA